MQKNGKNDGFLRWASSVRRKWARKEDKCLQRLINRGRRWQLKSTGMYQQSPVERRRMAAGQLALRRSAPQTTAEQNTLYLFSGQLPLLLTETRRRRVEIIQTWCVRPCTSTWDLFLNITDALFFFSVEVFQTCERVLPRTTIHVCFD